MTSKLGFGKPQNSRKISGRAEARTRAAKQFEVMKADGNPEFEVYIRIKGKKNWYPVGAIAVKRSSQINRAIFDSEDQLLQGAFRLFPILRKNQNQLEYGYRLKEFKDESIQLAEPPRLSGNASLEAAMFQLQSRISSLFKR
jgi:hypothetical protein